MFISENRYFHSPKSSKMLKIEHDANNNEFFSYENNAVDYFEPQYSYTNNNSTQHEQFYEPIDFQQHQQQPQAFNSDPYYYYNTPTHHEFTYNPNLVENCLNAHNSYALNSSSCSSSNATYQPNYQVESETNFCLQKDAYQNSHEYFYIQSQSCPANNYQTTSSNSDGSIMLGEESDDDSDGDEYELGDLTASASGGQKRKRKRVLNRVQRAEATQREKRRMLKLNRAFEELRKVLPITEFAKNKLSRAETLKSAIEYIDRLAQLLAI